MIGKITRGQNFSNTFAYIFDEKKQAQLVWGNVPEVLETKPKISSLAKRFSDRANSSRTKKPVYHVSFSPHQEDVNCLTPKLWNCLCSEFLDFMGLRDHQAVAVIHNDAVFSKSNLPRPHLHLVVNAVNLNGKCANFLLGLS